LLLPQELKELPGDEEIIFLEGCRPIRCRKNWFFKDRRLRKRLIAAAVLRYPRDRVRSRGHPL
jgi:type IV secretion system protein VirD4